ALLASMSEASIFLNNGDAAPILWPSGILISDMELQICSDTDPAMPSCSHIFCEDSGKNGYSDMARLRTAFTETNTQLPEPAPPFHGSFFWKYWLKCAENSMIFFSALSRLLFSINGVSSLEKLLIFSWASLSLESNSVTLCTTPAMLLWVKPSARLIKFPMFPISSELILDANSSQSKLRSSWLYGVINAR